MFAMELPEEYECPECGGPVMYDVDDKDVFIEGGEAVGTYKCGINCGDRCGFGGYVHTYVSVSDVEDEDEVWEQSKQGAIRELDRH